MGKAHKIGFNLLTLILAILVGLLSCDDDFDDFDTVTFSPISCENDSFTFDEGDLDLVINGEGFDGTEVDCIRAGANCNIDIEAQDIRLINCGECIKAESNGKVTLSAFDDIECDAKGDGVSAIDFAFIRLNAIEDIGIFSIEGNGIRAEDTSRVELDTITGTCTIDGPAGDIIQGNTAVVDTGDCNKVDSLEGLGFE
ncbi:MAG TPA: hypothetical protein VLB01_07310 [Thermodesulfobacteriota bacterium]|nr:hypothetical protein [Thermodesulfobacteriota bacterium]